LDRHSLDRLDYEAVIAAVAAKAATDGARAALARWMPFGDRAALACEVALLAEAIHRSREPGAWLVTAAGTLGEAIEDSATAPLDGPALVGVLRWLVAAEDTREAWSDEERRARHPRLAEHVLELSPPPDLRARLERSLDDDGSVRDSASPALGRARAEIAHGERRVEQQLERWARTFGSETYVTRHDERFVAMVPAAGFPRRRAIVHDVSNSGQSLLVEPLETCAENNRLMELRAAAAAEERRILRELASAVVAEAPALRFLEATLVHLDGLRARALWALEVGATAIAPGGDVLRLRAARHPVLAMAAARGGPEVVALDLDLAGEERLLLVSGPNMGGKTVLLKTVGLAVVLAHAALPVPASEGSLVPEIDDVLVDLGDAQSVEQGLSTFAAHLAVLRRMADRAGPRTLVLCDELGAGTDPEEGTALARALVEHVAARGAWGVITTHLGGLKRLAGEVAGVVNGSLEFDLETLSSRYRFMPGVPGASHALAVAERLGFPLALLQRARALTPEAARALERLTAELAAATRLARDKAAELDDATRRAASAAAEHAEATEHARRELAERRRALTRESDALLARARELWQTVQREARRSDKRREDAHRLKAEIDAAGREVESLAGAPNGAPAGPALAGEAITPGRRVRVVDLGVEAEIVSAPDREGRVTLKRGTWSIQSHVDKLREAPAPAAAEARPVAGTWSTPEDVAPLEIDLRGMDVDEALRTLDGGLDRAVVAGLAELRIIHGIGRGVLQAAVDRHLRGHPQVAGQRLGVVGEGGRGVTIVRLR
jgi:DNA mismatch repair protein MutS2